MWPSFTASRQQLDNPPHSRSKGSVQSNRGPRIRRILIVDDDEVTRDTFSRILRSAGYETTVAATASGALASAREGCDVILLDLRLGDESGLDVLQAIRTEGLRGPVVFVTGHADTRSAVAAMKLGAVDYVSKPLFEDGLLRVVEETLTAFGDTDEDYARSPGEDVESYAAARWAEAVVNVLPAPDDPKTVAAWARTIGRARGTIRNVCSMAGVSAKCSLDLARVLRAVSKAQAIGTWKPANFLNAPDPRTRARLLSAAGIFDIPRPTLEDVLARQRLIADGDALAALGRLLR